MKRIIMMITIYLCLVALLQMTYAQSEEEPLVEKLRDQFKKEYLSIGILMQNVADFQIDRSFAGHNGFSIANMRLKLSGSLDKNFGYFFQTNFAQSPAFLDAAIYYTVSPLLSLDIGLFKAPFSREFLTPAGSIDFVNRAQVINNFVPNRQIGMQASGKTRNRSVEYRLGIFNGNNFSRNGNDNDDLLYAARIAAFPEIPGADDKDSQFEIGLNVAFSDDENVNIGSGALRRFSGDRYLLGGDVRFTQKKLLVAAEFISVDLDAANGIEYSPNGGHITGGYMFAENAQLLLRWDHFSSDDLFPDSDLIILGYNLWPTQVTELQVNYIINTDDAGFDHHQLLLNAQVEW